jgi:repressor LexA
MEPTELTLRQRQILDFIEQQHAVDGRPPTRVEIATAFGFRSANAAEEHLRALARKGAIRLDGGRARGIGLLTSVDAEHKMPPPGTLPLIGQVAAGAPILAAEHVQDHIAVSPALFKPRADFLLRVRGSSMRDAGILDGDLLAVHRTARVDSGQIVVVRLGDEVTVKQLLIDGERVLLKPANPDFSVLRVDAGDSLVIEGLAVGVLRRGLAGSRSA